jgi:hypothetical protein
MPSPEIRSESIIDRQDRRTVSLTGHIVQADERTTSAKVIDLSYDGCGIECSANLSAGELVKLCVLKRGALEATVRWCSEGRAGLIFESKVVANAKAKKPRRHERSLVHNDVFLKRSNGSNYKVSIYDASPEGCKLEFVVRPTLDERVWVKFEGLMPLEARACWIENPHVGLRFTTPFHPAVFDLLVERLRKGKDSSPPVSRQTTDNGR